MSAKRLAVAESLAKYIVEGIDGLGDALLIPPLMFAQVLIANSDAVVLGSQLDDGDLYRPIVEMYMSVIKLAGSAVDRTPRTARARGIR